MDLTEIKGLITEQNRLFGEFKAATDKELKELKERGEAHPETKAQIDAMNARFDQIEVQLKKFTANLDLVSKDTNREGAKSLDYAVTEKLFRFGTKSSGGAFDHFTDGERDAYKQMRAKALAVTSDFGGGNLVPEDFQAQVIKKLANLAGVGTMVSRQATSRDVVRWPRINYTTDDIDNSALAMTWEDEPDTATSTDQGNIGNVSIQIKRARGLILVDRELLEDSAVDVMALISGLIADKTNVDLDRQFTNGSGPKKPEGFMVNADIPTVNSGSAGAFTFDGLISLVYALPQQYVSDARFMLPRTSMGAIRKLKDSQNRYLWEPSTQVGTPATLLGYPVFANEHVPAIASGAKALIFANFKQLYMVAEKVGLAIQRLDEKYADTDQVGFIFRQRVGGGVIAPWAGRIQVLT